MQVHLNVLLRDHELHVHSLDGGQGAPVEQFLGREPDTHLQLQTLKVHISVAFSLYKSFFKFEMAAVECCGEVVGLEDDCIVANIIVEVD